MDSQFLPVSNRYADGGTGYPVMASMRECIGPQKSCRDYVFIMALIDFQEVSETGSR
jgi:hypothetical protein